MRHVPVIIVLLLAASLAVAGDTQGAGRAGNPLPLHTSKGPPDVAAIRLNKTGKTMDAFLVAHESFLKRKTQGPIDLLFIGDSITAGWLSSGKQIRFLDFGGRFMDAKGLISKDIMPDGVHPGAAGYQLWAEAMQPLLEEMLK